MMILFSLYKFPFYKTFTGFNRWEIMIAIYLPFIHPYVCYGAIKFYWSNARTQISNLIGCSCVCVCVCDYGFRLTGFMLEKFQQPRISTIGHSCKDLRNWRKSQKLFVSKLWYITSIVIFISQFSRTVNHFQLRHVWMCLFFYLPYVSHTQTSIINQWRNGEIKIILRQTRNL